MTIYTSRSQAPRGSSPVRLQEPVAGSSLLAKLVKVVVLGLVVAAMALLLTSHEEEVEVMEELDEEVMDWSGVFDRVRQEQE